MVSTPKLQIVMPMVGLGSRFAKSGFSTPKPLIEVDGLPMFRKALSSLDSISAEKHYYFVIRQEHVDDQRLDQRIKQALPGAHVIVLPKLTRGAAESVLAAIPSLDPDKGLIALDCDLWFNSDGYTAMIEKSLNGTSSIDGGLLTFEADNTRYSYALIDDHGMVMRTAEKEVISHSAITGAYFFATSSTFAAAAKKLLSRSLGDTMKEYYISYVYNELLGGGKKIAAATVDQFASFGTPEELREYESHA